MEPIKSEITTGSRWLHIKTGNCYDVVHLAYNEKDLEPSVIYTFDYKIYWVRPIAEFLDGRFKRVS